MFPSRALYNARAYKHVPIQEDQKEVATALLAPPAGPLKIATLRTQPFGSRRAPTNWSRVTMLLKWIMSTVFHIVISVYVGYVSFVETAEAIQSAVEIFKSVCATLGFQLEAE